jgi:polar amino acid transport system ATP-binding protein
MIKAKEIYKSFSELEVLSGVSFEVEQGEAISIIGPSGSGKSTLLRSLIGLEKINSGELYIEGISVKKSGKKAYEKMGMVFQGFNLFPHKTVLGNLIEAPIVVKGVKKAAAEAKAEKLLKKVGLSDKKNSYPAQLSGGQKQRVAIARALLKNPRILILDDSTSSVDTETEAQIRTALNSLMQNRTTFIIAHRIQSVMAADMILVFDKGKIVQKGTHEELMKQSGMYREIFDIQTRIEVELEKEISSVNV